MLSRSADLTAPLCRVRDPALCHSCANLLLNAGAPIMTVQTVLGHKCIETTFGYARLCGGTIAADQAIAQVEWHFSLPEDNAAPRQTRPGC